MLTRSPTKKVYLVVARRNPEKTGLVYHFFVSYYKTVLGGVGHCFAWHVRVHFFN
jgi:hypothetical protein